jgi:hypothetical protein
MRAESVAKSIQMLQGILEGKTYVAIAQVSGLSRSAVEQRVKALARDLQTVVGVEWVDADEVPTVQGLRARKENYLEALEHYHPQRVVNAPKGPRALTGQDIDRAAAVIRQHSNCRKRDTALLLVLFSTAAKPLEIARLEVRDYLSEDGSVREDRCCAPMRPSTAKNGRSSSPVPRSSRQSTLTWKNAFDGGRALKSRRSTGDLIPTADCFSPGMDTRCRSTSARSVTGGNTGAGSSSTSTAGSLPGPDSKVCQHSAPGEQWQKNLPREAAILIRSERCSGSRGEIRSAI